MQEAGPHFYVWIIVADPEVRCQGLGSKLLEAINDLADQEGLHVRLEVGLACALSGLHTWMQVLHLPLRGPAVIFDQKHAAIG